MLVGQKAGDARADELPDKVVVTTYKSVTVDKKRACTEELGYINNSVLLRAPLGKRALVGCRAGHDELSEDAVCRDLKRSREHGVQPTR